MNRSSYLVIITIGPVQSLISQARKTQDLYAGSFLLSYLINHAMQEAKCTPNVDIITPDLDMPSQPNRFLYKISNTTKGELLEHVKSIENAVRDKVISLIEQIFAKINIELASEVNVQVADFIKFYWAAEEYSDEIENDNKLYSKAFVNLHSKLASAKSARIFAPISEPAGRKCSIVGEYNALFARKTNQSYTAKDIPFKLDSDNLMPLEKYIGETEALCTMAFLKRCLGLTECNRKSFDDNFASVVLIAAELSLKKLSQKTSDFDSVIEKIKLDPWQLFDNEAEPTTDCLDKLKEAIANYNIPLTPYYAVFQFDGDDIGQLYMRCALKKNVKMIDFQRNFSREISIFALEVNELMKDDGYVVYAGGEDFLGFCSVENVFKKLQCMHDLFNSIDLSKYVDDSSCKKLTFSAGITIAHSKTPLAEVLSSVRRAIKKAKEFAPDKNSFCIETLKHSGESLVCTQKFQMSEHNGLEHIEKMISYIISKKLSTGFLYALCSELESIVESGDKELGPKTREIILCEVKRQILRTQLISESEKQEIKKQIALMIEEFLKWLSAEKLEDILDLLKTVAFVARERGAVRQRGAVL